MDPNFQSGDVVIEVPDEAKGDITHPACRKGIVVDYDSNYVYVQLYLHGVLTEQVITCSKKNVKKTEKTYALA